MARDVGHRPSPGRFRASRCREAAGEPRPRPARAPACRRTPSSSRRSRRCAGRRSSSWPRSRPPRNSSARRSRKCRAEELLARDEQARFLLDHARDVIRQTAVRVRHVRAALHHDDLGFFVQPAQPRRARRAARHSANDDDLHVLSSCRGLLRRATCRNQITMTHAEACVAGMLVGSLQGSDGVALRISGQRLHICGHAMLVDPRVVCARSNAHRRISRWDG